MASGYGRLTRFNDVIAVMRAHVDFLNVFCRTKNNMQQTEFVQYERSLNYAHDISLGMVEGFTFLVVRLHKTDD